MKSKKTTRRALLTSMLSLLICVSMLVGSTFAWFTDSVTSANNVIKSGNLDITLEYWDGDSWEDVEGKSDILSEDLWEPGYVDVAYLRLKNAGSLALKYQLGVNIVSETEGVNQKGNPFKLSDYIYFDVKEGVDGENAAYANRDAALAVATETTKISAGYSKSGTLEANTGYVYLALVVHMPTTVGNEANHNGVNVPQIDLGINVFATQMEAEMDSFGPDYDAGAPWTGTVDTDWYFENPDATEFTISSGEELAGLAALVNGTATAPVTTFATEGTSVEPISFEGKTVKLAGDIDLRNNLWVPIGNVSFDRAGDGKHVVNAAFKGTFDGQEHTISNLKIADPEANGVGLFGAINSAATVKNVKIHNVNIVADGTAGAVVGYCIDYSKTSTIENCHVSGNISIVTDWAYVGGIVGYGHANVSECSVIADGTGVLTSENRNAVAGIMGWNYGSYVKDCMVKNIAITGWANVAGVVGYVPAGHTISECEVENVSLTKTRVDGIASIGMSSGGWSYNASKAITVTNNKFKNITLNGTYVANSAANILYGSEYSGGTTSNFVLDNNTTENITNNLVEVQAIKTAADLQKALDDATDGSVIVLAADITGDVTATQKPDVKITIDGYGHTFAGVLTVDGKSGTYTTAGLTIKSVVFKADAINAEACINLGEKGNNDTRYTCNVTVDNCTFDVPGAVGVKSYTGGDKNLTITGCTATSACHSMAQLKGIDVVKVVSCKVYSKNGLNFNNSDNVTVDGCEVDVKGYAVRFGESSGGVGAAETYLIKGCTLKSANDDGDATIILRGTADYATLTIENTTIVGTPDITNTATGATVVK